MLKVITLVKDYTKDDKDKLKISETLDPEVRETCHSLAELQEIVALKTSELAEWQTALNQAISLGVK